MKWAKFTLGIYWALFAWSYSLAGQPIDIGWDKTLGGSSWEELHSVTPTSDGGWLVAAITQSPKDGDVAFSKLGDWDYWLIKIDFNGNVQWQKRYGGNKADRIWISVETKDKGFIIGGESLSDVSGDKTEPNKGNWDFWLIKVDQNGELQWDKTIGGDGWDAIRGNIIETPDNGYLLAGISGSGVSGDKSESNRGDWDYWLVKIDERGNVLWDKTYGGSAKELMQSAIPLADGGFLLGGESRSGVSGDKDDFLRGLNDYWVVRVDAQGEMIWQKTIGGNWDEAIFDMVQHPNGIIYLAGFSGSDARFEKTFPSYGSIDFFVVAIDEQGKMLWNKNYGGKKPDTAYDIRVNALGNLVLGGISSSDISGSRTAASKGEIDYWVVCISPEGEQLWDVAFGGSKIDALTELEIATDGSLLLAGQTQTGLDGDKTEASRGVNDIWLIKTACKTNTLIADTIRVQCDQPFTQLNAAFSDCQDCSYFWSNGSRDSFALVLSSEQNTFYAVTGVDINGCLNRDSTFLFYDEPTAASFDVTGANCEINLQLESVVGGEGPYSFILSNEDYNANRAFLTLNPGERYAIAVKDANGCSFDSIIQFGSNLPLEVLLPDEDIVVELGDSISIEALPNRAVQTVIWTNLQNTDCDTCLFTTFLPFEPLTIGVQVFDEFGCAAADKVNIFVQRDYDTYIPNIFSPNGDGDNDNFTIFAGKDVVLIRSLRVFDRWGQPVFEAYNILPNDPSVGWQGTVSDNLSPPNIYIYFGEVEFIDGHVALIKGDVALTR